ncbi:MAG: hypothetical protein KAJ19_12375, partial [Gammaproteobacteria bacterium]|nr:hypothetical protein [Gammaproteobacteria bacterium]
GVWVSPDGFSMLCTRRFRNKVDVPVDVQTMHAVFTKTLRGPDDFTIVSRSAYGWYSTGVKEFKGHLFISAREVLHEKYNAGYRYVHFEYVELA